MTNGILHALSIDANGLGTMLADEAISAVVKSEQLAWVHLDVNEPDSKRWMNAELDYLDSIIIDALLAEETRPGIGR